MRERIIAAGTQLGYRPNQIARSLTTQKSRLIGISVGYMENQFYPSILELISIGFAAHGYRVVLLTPGSGGNADLVLEEVMRHRLDAVVLASARLTSSFAAECTRAGIPVVLLNRRTDAATCSSVTGQNEHGGRVIAQFFMSIRPHHIAFMAGLEDSSTSRERERGFMGALRDGGYQEPARAVGHYDFAAACAATRLLLSAARRPDALFCANDHMALAAIETARSEFGLHAGRDLSIVGFDDVTLASWPGFSLTTYSQPVGPMADCLVQETLRLLRDDSSQPAQLVVPGKLVIRMSAPHQKQH